MADEVPGGASPKNEPSRVEIREDEETRAARRELKQSSISDPVPDATGTASTAGDKAAHPATPASDVPDAPNDVDLKEMVASPKKKRAHDQLDRDHETEETDANSVASTDSAKDRASRLEPEKKRHRDGDFKDGEQNSTSASTDETTKLETNPPSQGSEAATKSTSASSFAASTFGKLSTTASPFVTLGSSSGNAFGSAGAHKLTSFASSSSSSPAPSTAQSPAAPKLTFGSAGGASPFAGLSSGSNGFGSTLGGGGFGSTLTGIKPLGSFASGNKEAPKNDKPARPFGAPDSDAEDSDDVEDDDDDAQPEEAERAASPEKDTDDKKKLKLQKIEVNDGEAGEATIISVRAKMFHHDKEAGWKERGAGMLKINVPQACVEFDDSGALIPGTFDASGLEADDDEGTKGHKVARLIMRQDQTHRVILNTAILPAMKFQEKASLKSVGILFTAFEGAEAKPVSITMRMSATNAKSFMNEISVIQRELQSN